MGQEQLNTSLDDVIAGLEREIARLQTSLETIRLSSHPERIALIRWHVSALDERQDALERMRELSSATAVNGPLSDSNH